MSSKVTLKQNKQNKNKNKTNCETRKMAKKGEYEDEINDPMEQSFRVTFFTDECPRGLSMWVSSKKEEVN